MVTKNLLESISPQASRRGMPRPGFARPAPGAASRHCRNGQPVAKFRAVLFGSEHRPLKNERDQQFAGSICVERARRSTSECAAVRAALYEAAIMLLRRSARPSALKSWGMRVARRRGHKMAVVAIDPSVRLNRKLAADTEPTAYRA